MERVTIISPSAGKEKAPVIFIAPHGFQGDDYNTAKMALTMAHHINAYAVINNGWERSEKVDFLLDKANCNNIQHCHEDVVKEEFLDPIFRFQNKILKTNKKCHIYYIHGMSDDHKKIANDGPMDVIIGFGNGTPTRYTCPIWRKDVLCSLLVDSGMAVWEGKAGGKMSGWGTLNMNQLFKTMIRSESMQIEISYENRRMFSKLFSEAISEKILESLQFTNFSTNVKFKTY